MASNVQYHFENGIGYGKLPDGTTFVFDEECFDRIRPVKWYISLQGGTNPRPYLIDRSGRKMHTYLIRCPKGYEVDHISLDTLDETCSRRITRRDELGRTLEGISEALKYPEISLKINCVPLGIPDQDLCKVAFLARDHKVHVRFIEMMPIGMGKEFHGVSEEELLGILGEKLPRFSPYVGEPLGNGPCHYYDVDGFSGKIGFISAVSHKFCGECNRIRLTSQGFLKTCLQYAAGRDLRAVIRGGGSDEELKAVILEALAEKPDGHAFGVGLEKQKDDKTEKLCMAQIGG